MIQDIAPHYLDNQFKPGKTPSADSPVVCFDGRNILLRRSAVDTTADTTPEGERPVNFALAETKTEVGKLPFLPTYGELPEDTNTYFLFSYDGVDVYRAKVSVQYRSHDEPGVEYGSEDPVIMNKAHNTKVMEGFLFDSIRDIRQRVILEKNQVFLLMTALQLHNWYVDNRYCGRCATRVIHSPKERALICPECNRTIYPRILPAVIVAVTYHNKQTGEDKIMLTKYSPKHGTSYSFYALVAGFTEIGETLEECVQREVMEEIGVKIKNIRYYKSQPWGVVDDLLMGYYCEFDEDAQRELYGDEIFDEKGDPIVHLDKDELKTGVWLTPEEMTLQPDAYSLTNEMMLLFKAKKVHSPADIPLDFTRDDVVELEREFYK